MRMSWRRLERRHDAHPVPRRSRVGAARSHSSSCRLHATRGGRATPHNRVGRSARPTRCCLRLVGLARSPGRHRSLCLVAVARLRMSRPLSGAARRRPTRKQAAHRGEARATAPFVEAEALERSSEAPVYAQAIAARRRASLLVLGFNEAGTDGRRQGARGAPAYDPDVPFRLTGVDGRGLPGPAGGGDFVTAGGR
jgi:hypothetical protein